MSSKPQSVAGALRHRITIQQKTDGVDAWGGTVATWTDYVTLWAEVMHMSGNEFWAARQANSEIEGRVRIRYRDDIDPTMRISYNGTILEILSVVPYDSRKTELHLMFREMLT